MKHVFLFGFKGSGKTFWGKRISEAFHHPFIDTDKLIEDLYAREYGISADCSTIYQQEGEEKFRFLERQILHSLQEKEPSIVALGGGTPLYPQNLQLIQTLGRLVYLKVDKAILQKRLLERPKPAFFKKGDSFESLYEERFPRYASIPGYCVDLQESEEKIMAHFKEILHGQ